MTLCHEDKLHCITLVRILFLLSTAVSGTNYATITCGFNVLVVCWETIVAVTPRWRPEKWNNGHDNQRRCCYKCALFVFEQQLSQNYRYNRPSVCEAVFTTGNLIYYVHCPHCSRNRGINRRTSAVLLYYYGILEVCVSDLKFVAIQLLYFILHMHFSWLYPRSLQFLSDSHVKTRGQSLRFRKFRRDDVTVRDISKRCCAWVTSKCVVWGKELKRGHLFFWVHVDNVHVVVTANRKANVNEKKQQQLFSPDMPAWLHASPSTRALLTCSAHPSSLSGQMDR